VYDIVSLACWKIYYFILLYVCFILLLAYKKKYQIFAIIADHVAQNIILQKEFFYRGYIPRMGEVTDIFGKSEYRLKT